MKSLRILALASCAGSLIFFVWIHYRGQLFLRDDAPVSWAVTVFIPYLLFLVLFIFVKGRGKGHRFYEKVIELGMDTSILGVGVSAALFGSREFNSVFDGNAMTGLLLVCLFDFLIIALYANVMEKKTIDKPLKAFLGIYLCAMVLGINTGLVAYANHDQLWLSIGKGFWALFPPVGSLVIAENIWQRYTEDERAQKGERVKLGSKNARVATRKKQTKA